jgi:uncharacterized membrane protein YdjX (TVP38/TMEM64 family)
VGGVLSRRGKILAYAAVAAVALFLLFKLGGAAGRYVPAFAQWVARLGIWGPLVFILGYAVATVAFIPGSLLTLAAGAIFGLVRGTLYTFAGATLGAAAAFLVARYVARGAIEKKIAGNPRFDAIDRAVSKEGFKIVALLRLSPVFPFNLLNYSLGLTRVRFLDYLLASVAMLPGTLLYVYDGKAAGSLAAVAGGTKVAKGTEYWGSLGIGLLATLVVTTFITRLARRALAQQIDGAPAPPAPPAPEKS